MADISPQRISPLNPEKPQYNQILTSTYTYIFKHQWFYAANYNIFSQYCINHQWFYAANSNISLSMLYKQPMVLSCQFQWLYAEKSNTPDQEQASIKQNYAF